MSPRSPHLPLPRASAVLLHFGLKVARIRSIADGRMGVRCAILPEIPSLPTLEAGPGQGDAKALYGLMACPLTTIPPMGKGPPCGHVAMWSSSWYTYTVTMVEAGGGGGPRILPSAGSFAGRGEQAKKLAGSEPGTWRRCCFAEGRRAWIIVGWWRTGALWVVAVVAWVAWVAWVSGCVALEGESEWGSFCAWLGCWVAVAVSAVPIPIR